MDEYRAEFLHDRLKGKGIDMKIKDGFILREVGGQTLVVATGEASKTFKGMVKLNDTARDIWQWVSEGCEESEIVRRLGETYDVTPELAATDTATMIAQMREAGFIVD